MYRDLRLDEGSAGPAPFTGSPADGSQSTLLKAMGAFTDSTRPHRANPLHFSTFQLLQQPNGGHGRILVKVRPHALPEEAPIVGRATVYCPDSDLPSQQHLPKEEAGAIVASSSVALRSPVMTKPFWFRTNEGDITVFDAAYERCKPQFGVAHGERVLSTWGPTAGTWSTVIGVRNGTLWVKDDGAPGATALYGLGSREAIESALGWVSHGSQHVEPSTSVQVPVLSADGSFVELRRVACDPATMALCFGEGRYHGSIHVVTTLAFEAASDNALLFVPVGVDTTTGDLVAFLVERSQTDMSATLMGGQSGEDAPEAVLQALLFGRQRTFALNRSTVTPSLVFACVLEGVQNPEGVTALLRPERLGASLPAAADVGARAGAKVGYGAALRGAASEGVLTAARITRANAAAPLLDPAAKVTSHEGYATFLAYRGEPLPIGVFTNASVAAHGAIVPHQARMAIRQPSVQFFYRPNSGQ